MRARPATAIFLTTALAAALSLSGSAIPAPASATDHPNWTTAVSSFEALETDCTDKDVLFVGVRGSGEPWEENDGMGSPVAVFRNALQDSLGGDLSVEQVALEYPAYPIESSVGSELSSLVGGLLFAKDRALYGIEQDKLLYFESVDAGTTRLLDLLADHSQRCPNQKVILSGYSSGALVVHKALSSGQIDANLVAGIALIADPGRDADAAVSSAGFYGSAVGANGLLTLANSVDWLAPVTDKLGTDVSPIPPELRAKVFEMCRATDVVCDSVGWTLDAILNGDVSLAVHTQYGNGDEHVGNARALAEMADRMSRSLTNKVPGEARTDALIGRQLVTIGQYSNQSVVEAATDLNGNTWAGSSNGGALHVVGTSPTGAYKPFFFGYPGGSSSLQGFAVDEFGYQYSVFSWLRYGDTLTSQRKQMFAKWSPTGSLVFANSVEFGYTASIDVGPHGDVYLMPVNGGVQHYSASGLYLGDVGCGGGIDFSIDGAGKLHILVRPWPEYSTSPLEIYVCDPHEQVSVLKARLPWRTFGNIATDSAGVDYVGRHIYGSIARIPVDGTVEEIQITELPRWEIPVSVSVGRDDTVYASFTDWTTSPYTAKAVKFTYGEIREFDAAPLPTVAGTLQIGKTLTAKVGTWKPTLSATQFQWLRSGQPIQGATGKTYTLTPEDHGAQISVAVTGDSLGRFTTTKESAGTAPITWTPFSTIGVPTIAGTLTVGKILTAKIGTWSPRPTGLAYQWLRDGQAIAGATSSTYALTADDVAKAISVNVTATAQGYEPVDVSAAATAQVADSPFAPTTPTIAFSGDVIPGRLLTAKTGYWNYGGTFTYQWLRNGEPIADATAKTYSVSAADGGTKVSVEVTAAAGGGYPTATLFSEPVDAWAGKVAAKALPSAAGTLAVGQILTVKVGTWSPSPVAFQYQWTVDGTAIDGAVGKTIVVTDELAGRCVGAIVTGTHDGFLPTSLTAPCRVVPEE